MKKIKEYVFKKTPETKLEEKKDIVNNNKKEEKKITINPNKIHNEKLKSFYESKISLYNFLGLSFGLFGLFLVLNSTLYIFDLQITDIFIKKTKSSLIGKVTTSFILGLMLLGGAGGLLNTKVKKYEQLLKELK